MRTRLMLMLLWVDTLSASDASKLELDACVPTWYTQYRIAFVCQCAKGKKDETKFSE